MFSQGCPAGGSPAVMLAAPDPAQVAGAVDRYMALREFRTRLYGGKPWHLIAHEDVLIFRAPGKSAGSGKLKDSQREPKGPVPVAAPSGTRVRGEPAKAA